MAVLPLCGTVSHSVRQLRSGNAPTLWDSLALCEAAEKWQCTHSVGQSCIHSMRQRRNGSAPTLWGSLAFCEAADSAPTLWDSLAFIL